MNENEKESSDGEVGSVAQARENLTSVGENGVDNASNTGETLQSEAVGDAAPRKRRRLSLAEKALIVVLSSAVSGGLSLLVAQFSFIIAAILVLYMVAAPVAGIVMGITAMFERERTKRTVVTAAVAVALPLVAVLVVILCLSTGVFVIRFM